MKKIIIAASVALSSVSLSSAQIAAWEFNGNTGNEISVSATTIDPNLDPSAVIRGSGINASGLANSFSATDFTLNGTQANAIANNDFFEFSVSSKTGFTLSLSTLDVTLRRSSTGPNTYIWRYSIGSGFTTIGSPVSYTSTATSGVAQTQLNLSSISALQDLSSTATATFRLYAYGTGTATTGTFAIGRLAGNDLAVGGSVTAVPEPHHYALGIAGLVMLVVVARRRRMVA